MKSQQSIFTEFDTIKHNGFQSSIERIRFIDTHTSGFEPEYLKALKFELDCYIEFNNIVDTALQKYESYRKSVNPARSELLQSAYSELGRHGIHSTSEGWGIVFDKILKTWYDENDPFFTAVWEFMEMDKIIRKKINESRPGGSGPAKQFSVDRQVAKLAGVYKRNSNVKYDRQVLEFIFTHAKSNPELLANNMARLIRIIQSEASAPVDLSDQPGSQKHQKRIRNALDYYRAEKNIKRK